MISKVIQLTPWYAPYIGGVELHVKSISEGLRRLGCDVQIFTFTKSSERDTKSFRFLRIPAINECYGILPSPALLEELRQSDADIIHAHSYGYPMAWAASYVRKTQGIPFIFTPHSDPYSRIYPMFDAGRLLPVRICDMVIATTKFEEEHFKAMGISSAKIRVIPQGLEVQSPGPRPIDEPYILCLGRVVFHHKGQDMLLRAYERGAFSHKLVFAGDGPDLPKLRKMVVGNPNVMILGSIRPPEKWAWLGNADLIVMPSRLEPFGHVALEAIAMRRKLVVTKVGGLQHIAAPYAMLAEPDPVSLAESMHSALQSQSRADDFSFASWQTIAQATFDVYNEVIAREAKLFFTN